MSPAPNDESGIVIREAARGVHGPAAAPRDDGAIDSIIRVAADEQRFEEHPVSNEERLPPRPLIQPPVPRDRVRSIKWGSWLVIGGAISLFLSWVIKWCHDVLLVTPVIGIIAILSVAAIVVGAGFWAWNEYKSLSLLREIKHHHDNWYKSDGEQLRRMMINVGQDLGDTEKARRAVDIVHNAGPDAARRELSKNVLAPIDQRVATAIAVAARQSFVIVTASPSPAFDSLLMILRSIRLLREIATLYGYRPSPLTIKNLALEVGRDAAAVAIADVFAEAAAEEASKSLADGGTAIAAMGMGLAVTPVGAVVAGALSAVGLGMSFLGRTVGASGGAIGGGATAAWRVYRFGLLVMVSIRPVPFDKQELSDLRKLTRAQVLSFAFKKQKPAPDARP